MQGTIFIIYYYCKYKAKSRKYRGIFEEHSICTPNSMKFEALFLKLLQFLDIQGSISDWKIYMP